MANITDIKVGSTTYKIQDTVSGYVTHDTYPTDLSWTAGSSEGPVPKISRAGTTTSAVTGDAIPSASATASGIVTTGKQTFAGQKSISSPIIYHSRYPEIIAKAPNASGPNIGEIFWDVGATNSLSANRLYLRQMSPNTTATTNTMAGGNETYRLPAVAKGLTDTVTYDILTSKNTVTVAQGGTGLTDSPSMLVNLASTTAADVLVASPRPGVTGTLGAAHGGTGQTTLAKAASSLIDNLSTATANMSDAGYIITGDASSTTSTTYYRRPAEKIVNATLVKSALGTTTTSAGKFLKDDGTWAVPEDTDTKVTQTVTTTNATYPILTCATSSNTSTVTGTSRFDTKVFINHSTGKIISAGSISTSTASAGGFSLMHGEAYYGTYHIGTAGTTETVGATRLFLGNSVASGTADNARGLIYMYGTGTSYSIIQSEVGNTARTVKLPDISGTVILDAGTQTISGAKTFNIMCGKYTTTVNTTTSVRANSILSAVPTSSGLTNQIVFVTA